MAGTFAGRLGPLWANVRNTEPARSLALLTGGLALIMAFLAITPAPRPMPVSLVLVVDPPAAAAPRSESGGEHSAPPPEEPHSPPDTGHDDTAPPEKSHDPAPEPPAIGDSMARLALSDGALDPAPDLGLIEEAADGFLPRIGADGRRPDAVYARPFADPLRRSRIAIVIRGFGLAGDASRDAVEILPAEVALAVSPYAGQPQFWTNQARATGHEVLLDLPMEPHAFPDQDPGPHALLTRLAPPERMVRLHRLLTSTTGYAGVVTRMGRAFLSSEADLRPVLTDIARRGLFFLEDGTAERSVAGRIAPSLSLPYRRADRPLDAQPSRRTVDLALLELEAVARAQGRAIGVGTVLPVTLARIKAWAPTLAAKGLVLAPVSAMMTPSTRLEGVQHAALAEP
ncbi:MAG: divergent polysaccharide deacetylase family protein [Alphaproteobacteria bacterium]